jgi:hypothetical protein
MKNEEEQTQDKLKKNKFQKVDVIIEKDWWNTLIISEL